MRKKNKQLNVHGLNMNIWDYCITVAVSFLIFLVLFVSRFYVSETHKSEIELIQSVMEQNGQNQKLQFEGYIERNIQLLQNLVTYPEVYEMNAERQSEFLYGKSAGFGFEHIFVINSINLLIFHKNLQNKEASGMMVGKMPVT